MLSAPHDLSPCLRPGDEVTYLGGRPWEDRTGRSRWAEFYLVLHRAGGAWTEICGAGGAWTEVSDAGGAWTRVSGTGGAWTHLYRVAPGARLELVLVHALEGDARAELRELFFAGGSTP